MNFCFFHCQLLQTDTVITIHVCLQYRSVVNYAIFPTVNTWLLLPLASGTNWLGDNQIPANAVDNVIL